MTTANIIVFDLATEKYKNYMLYHDGYMADKIIQDMNMTNFSIENINENFINNDIVPLSLRAEMQKGEYTYTLIIKNKNEAILSGSGYMETKVTKIHAKNPTQIDKIAPNTNNKTPKKAPTP